MALASIVAILFVAILAMPMMSFAADVRRGQDLEIGQGTTISEDVYLLGGTVEFGGRAQKDVSIVAGQLDFTGEVVGSMNVAAGNGDIAGRIGGSLRVIGGQTEITGDVSGDVIVLGGRVTIPSASEIGGDLILMGGQVDARGRINGDITGIAGSLIVAGQVRGNVDVSVGSLDVRSTARIDGDLRYRSTNDGEIASGADIGGEIERPSGNPWDSVAERNGFFGPALRVLWALLAGAALILAMPKVATALASAAGRPLAATGIGVIAIWLIPIVAIVLLVTVVGFPLGAIVLAGYLVALYLSQIAVGLAIGRFILPNGWHDGSRGFYLLAMTIGVLLIAVLKLIPVPWVAGIVGLIVTLWGLGALLLLVARASRTAGSSEVAAPVS